MSACAARVRRVLSPSTYIPRMHRAPCPAFVLFNPTNWFYDLHHPLHSRLLNGLSIWSVPPDMFGT